MTATAHAAIGVVIASKIGNPAFAIPIALTSHFVADMIPHWDTATHRKEKSKKDLWTHSIVDITVALGITFLLVNLLFSQTPIFYAYLIVFFALLPDILTAPYMFLDIRYPFIYFHKLQKKFDQKLDKPWGIIIQAVVVILFVLLAKLN